jgi:hypothetical protein
LPDLEFSKTGVLNNRSRFDVNRGYGHAIDQFYDRDCSEPGPSLNRTKVLHTRSDPEVGRLVPGSVNLGLGDVRRIAYRSADFGLLSSEFA